jgi:intein-encoded DNA endonuclease-like protein
MFIVDNFNTPTFFSAKKDITLGYVVGVVMGDGTISPLVIKGHRYNRVRLSVRDREFAEAFYQALTLLGFKARLFNGGNTWIGRERFEACAYTNDFCEWISKLKLKDIKRLATKSKGFAKGFIEGFFDSEGTICLLKPRKPNHKFRELYIGMYNTNKKLLEAIQKILLEQFEIKFDG